MAPCSQVIKLSSRSCAAPVGKEWSASSHLSHGFAVGGGKVKKLPYSDMQVCHQQDEVYPKPLLHLVDVRNALIKHQGLARLLPSSVAHSPVSPLPCPVQGPEPPGTDVLLAGEDGQEAVSRHRVGPHRASHCHCCHPLVYADHR